MDAGLNDEEQFQCARCLDLDPMKSLFRHFNRTHLYIFLGFYVIFAALTFFVLNGGTPSDRRDTPFFWATAGAVSGPFTGAIARHFQSCCLQFSWGLFPFCAAFFGVGVVAQVVPLPFPQFERRIRLAMWCIGLLGWFAGIPFSFLHALS
jgi:hypothetical protein